MNEPVNVILVDDEPRALSVLNNLLDNYNINIVGECSNLEDAIELINKNNPQVVFLDIQMPNYAGYEIVNFFTEINFEIVFVTAYDEYAIKAFDLSAIDYLVKPINRERLSETILKIEERLDTKDKLNHYEVLLKNLKDIEPKKLVIPELNNKRIINLSDIIAIEAEGAYTKIHMLDNYTITTSKNLKHYQNILEAEKYFFRSHRSWLVNLNFLQSINRTNYKLHLTNTIEAKISRNQIDAFERLIC